MIGGLLALSGAIMQGLFRNPLADPALVWGWYEWRRLKVRQARPNPAQTHRSRNIRASRWMQA